MTASISPLAGKTLDPSLLVDVPRLVTAYFTGRPDPANPAQRVAFGTSGHRGSAFDDSFNEAHVLRSAKRSANTGTRAASMGRCSPASTPTPCHGPHSRPRWKCSPRTASTSSSTRTTQPRRPRSSRTRSSPTTRAGRTAWRMASSSALPARGWRLQIQSAAWRPGRDRRDGRMPAEHAELVLGLLPCGIDFVLTFWVSRPLAPVALAQIVKTSQANELEWCPHDFVGEFREFARTHAKAPDSFSAGGLSRHRCGGL